MLREASWSCLVYIAGLFIVSFSSNKLLAQQNILSQKTGSLKTGMTTVYLNLHNRHDTTFQSGDKLINSGVNNSSHKLPSKIYPHFENNSNKIAKTYSIEEDITLIISTAPTSCGYGNGSIVISATGGIAPYTFSYTNSGYTYSQNTGNFQNLTAGSYQLTVTDASGQTTSTLVTLPNNFPAPFVTLSSYQLPTGCSSFDGTMTLSASGGVPPYLYSLDNVNYQASNVFSYLAQGVYHLFVKDGNGCVYQNASVIFFLSDNNRCFGLGLSYSGLSCNNNGRLTIPDVYYGVPPYQYSLDGISYQADNNFYNLGTGFHYLYIKDATGFINLHTLTIFPYCPLYVEIVDATCSENNGKLTAIPPSNGTPPYTFSLDGINYQNSNIFTGLAAGNYTVTAKDANGISASAYAAISAKCPGVTATATDETCGQKNGTIISTGFDGTTPYQFSIDGTNFQNSNTFDGLTAGGYTVTIKDSDGFTGTTPVIVNSNCFQIDVGITNEVCSNTNGRIKISVANGTAPYQYSIDGINFQGDNMFTGLAAGNYRISVKDADNAKKDTAVIIKDAPSPQINVAATQPSCNNTDGSIKINGIGGTAPLQYSIDNITFQDTNIFNNLDSGKYVAYIKDANGCLDTDTVLLTALTAPTVFIGNDTSLCNGEILMLVAPQSPGSTFLWQDNTTAYNNPITKQGIYHVKVTNQFNCSASDTIEIKYRSVPGFTIGNDSSLCSGQPVLLKPIPLFGSSYLWSTGAISSSLSINSGGLYWLQITDSGCVRRDTINIKYKSIPTLNFYDDTTLCAGKTIILDATNSNAIYTWQDGSTQATYSVNKAGLYSVKVSKDGCDTSGKILVNYISKPVVKLGSDTTLCITQHLLLNASYPQSSYLWQNGSTLAYHDVVQAGTYAVDVTNTCGVTHASINVNVENCACKFYIPSAFTPNNDGKNDVFKTGYHCLFSNYEMKLFNRFGQLIFISQNPANGWDGSFKNELQPVGIYVYELTYKNNLAGKLIRTKGWVTLLR